MFTGIVKDIGKISKISRKDGFWNIGVKSKEISARTSVSGSVTVNGVCLTMVKKERDTLYFDVVTPTLKISNLKRLKIGDYVNLEPSLSIGDKLEGHFVLGHIDTESKLRRIIKEKGSFALEIDIRQEFKKYLVPKGSITLDGISLTIAEIKNSTVLINIIPFTWDNTNLRYKKAGMFINVEFDYLVKSLLNKRA